MTGAQLSTNPRERSLESAERHPVPPRKRDGDAARRWALEYGSRRVLGMRVDATTYREASDAIAAMAGARSGGMVCVATVHMVMESFDDPSFRSIVNSADRVTPDGVPLIAALRILGIPGAQRVYGPDLTVFVCQRAEELGLPVGFYGGSEEVLEKLVRKLTSRFPRLEVPFAHAPPFRPLSDAEDEAVTDAIESSGAKILFVGLGCPKQERWMAEHRESLHCVMVGVGAAFDFISGNKSQAPGWMRRNGLEWFYRLLAEPRRLWRRYLIGNSRFLYHFALELLRSRWSGSGQVERTH